MPARVVLRRFQQIERFICPFLAPRVFAPWPKHQKLSSAQSNEAPEEGTWRPVLAGPTLRLPNKRESTGPAKGSEGGVNEAYRNRLVSYRRRAKTVHLKRNPETGEFDGFSLSWTMPFAALESRFDQQVLARPEVELDLDPEVDDWVRRLKLRTSFSARHEEEMAEIWAGFPAESREYRWSQVLLWALCHSTKHVLRFLRATHKDTHPPGYAVADSLDYVTCCYLKGVKVLRERRLSELYRTILFLLKKRSNTLPLRQRTLYLLLKHLDIGRAITLHDALIDHSVPMHHHTLFHFIKAFATKGYFGRAYTLLDYVGESGADFSTKQGMSMWSTLLRLSKTGGDSRTRSELLQRMIEYGVRPNVINYCIILENVLETEGWEAAWRVFKLMKEDGVVPDKHIYAVLFKGAKNRGEKEAMGHILDLARADGHLLQNAHLVTDLIHAVYMSIRGVAPYSRIVDTYKRYFDLQPLKDLRLVYQHLPQADPDTLMQPTPVTLGVMILAFLDLRNDPNTIPAHYSHYRSLIDQGAHPLITQLTSTTHIADAYLLALGSHPQTLPLCTTVISDMLTLLPYPSPTTPAPPTVQTWSILVRSYMRHKQSAAAERVLSMMSRMGMRPNEVTWNTLISGYAGMQDVEGAVGAMARMEDEGWWGDERTLEGLGRIIDRDKLLAALKKTPP
jgi:pentatricopeptide repeat protein